MLAPKPTPAAAPAPPVPPPAAAAAQAASAPELPSNQALPEPWPATPSANAAPYGAPAESPPPARTLLADAGMALEQGRHADAAEAYRRAAEHPEADLLAAHMGLYLALHRLRRTDEAAAALSRLVATGLAQRTLPMRLLFKPGSTDYLPEAALGAPYAEWVAEVARQVQRSADVCLVVAGHSGKGRGAEAHAQLGLWRAQRVQRALQAAAPAMAKRARLVNIGAREPLVGSGSNDLRDALDRRVEFKVVGCR